MYIKKWNPELDSFQIVYGMERFKSKEDFLSGLIHPNADERVLSCVVRWWGARDSEVAMMIATHKKAIDYHLIKVIEQSNSVPAIVASIEHKKSTEEVFSEAMKKIDTFNVDEQIAIKSAIDMARERIEVQRNTLRYKVTSKCLSIVQCMGVALEYGFTNAVSFFENNVLSRVEEKPFVDYELPSSDSVKYNLDNLSSYELFELAQQVDHAKKKRFERKVSNGLSKR